MTDPAQPPPPPPGSQTPPDPAGNPWRKFRGLAAWKQITAWVVVALAALWVIGALSGGDGKTDADPASTKPAAVAAPKPDEAEAPADIDTGRMSDDEWDRAGAATQDANRAIIVYADEVSGKCALISRGGQLAEAIDCIDKAHSEMESGVMSAWDDLDRLKGDVAKGCKVRLGQAADALDETRRRLTAAKTLLTSGEFAAANVATKASGRAQSQWNRASRVMLSACKPT